MIEILKKTLYLCACFISSFALSFVIIYFILVFKLSSKNAALTVSALTGICLAAFFTLVNSILRCRKEAKLNEKALRYARIQHLTLLERREFFSVFISCFNITHARQRGCCIYTKHSLWIISRKSSPLNAEDAVRLIQIRNAYPDKAATVCVLGGTDTAAAALMSENGCTIMPSEDLEKLIFFLPDDAISACTPKSSRSSFAIYCLKKSSPKGVCVPPCFSASSLFFQESVCFILLQPLSFWEQRLHLEYTAGFIRALLYDAHESVYI